MNQHSKKQKQENPFSLEWILPGKFCILSMPFTKADFMQLQKLQVVLLVCLTEIPAPHALLQQHSVVDGIFDDDLFDIGEPCDIKVMCLPAMPWMASNMGVLHHYYELAVSTGKSVGVCSERIDTSRKYALCALFLKNYLGYSKEEIVKMIRHYDESRCASYSSDTTERFFPFKYPVKISELFPKTLNLTLSTPKYESLKVPPRLGLQERVQNGSYFDRSQYIEAIVANHRDYQRTSRGAGPVTFIGPSGSGKTTLLENFIAFFSGDTEIFKTTNKAVDNRKRPIIFIDFKCLKCDGEGILRNSFSSKLMEILDSFGIQIEEKTCQDLRTIVQNAFREILKKFGITPIVLFDNIDYPVLEAPCEYKMEGYFNIALARHNLSQIYSINSAVSSSLPWFSDVREGDDLLFLYVVTESIPLCPLGEDKRYHPFKPIWPNYDLHRESYFDPLRGFMEDELYKLDVSHKIFPTCTMRESHLMELGGLAPDVWGVVLMYLMPRDLFNISLVHSSLNRIANLDVVLRHHYERINNNLIKTGFKPGYMWIRMILCGDIKRLFGYQPTAPHSASLFELSDDTQRRYVPRSHPTHYRFGHIWAYVSSPYFATYPIVDPDSTANFKGKFILDYFAPFTHEKNNVFAIKPWKIIDLAQIVTFRRSKSKSNSWWNILYYLEHISNDSEKWVGGGDLKFCNENSILTIMPGILAKLFCFTKPPSKARSYNECEKLELYFEWISRFDVSSISSALGRILYFQKMRNYYQMFHEIGCLFCENISKIQSSVVDETYDGINLPKAFAFWLGMILGVTCTYEPYSLMYIGYTLTIEKEVFYLLIFYDCLSSGSVHTSTQPLAVRQSLINANIYIHCRNYATLHVGGSQFDDIMGSKQVKFPE